MKHIKRTPEERAALLVHLRENYVYEPEGRIRYKGRDRPTKGYLRPSTERNKNPYLCLQFLVHGIRFLLLYQQAVWLVYKGRWPTMQLDHLNGNPKDNRIENLRECSPRDNNLNRYYIWKPNKITGVPGVLYNRGSFLTRLRGKQYRFYNRYEAFFWAIICGKKYY